MIRAISFALVVQLSVCVTASAAISPCRPVVMMHGVTGHASDVQKNADAVQARCPGTYVKLLKVYEGESGLLASMEPQLSLFTSLVQSDEQLVHGFNLYGESQGGLLARAFVVTSNKPPVHNLVSVNGPQAGVGECPKVEVPKIKQLCGDLGTDLQIYKWPFCSFCSYWKGKDKQGYLGDSQWLADINNDRKINETRRDNMMSLNKYMATVALQDTIVQPPWSAWHSYWAWGSKRKVMNLNETDGYKSDALGLKTLAERGDLILNSFDGGHLRYTMDWWKTNVLPMLDNKFGDSESSQAIV